MAKETVQIRVDVDVASDLETSKALRQKRRGKKLSWNDYFMEVVKDDIEQSRKDLGF